MIKLNKNNNRNYIQKEKILLIGVSLLILSIHLMHINKLGIFYVLDDEFGYWSNAAYLAGYDWSSATSNIAYYSYGYSILLVPLFWIFDNPIHMYRAAIVLNAVMMSGSFLICYDMAKKLAKDTNRYLLMAISFIISMYPAYIVQANVAWSECALIFVCCLLAWNFIDLNDKSSIIKFFLLGFLNAYAYIIHQRAIGILVASFLVISLMKLFKRINWKQYGMFILVLTVMFIIHRFIKNDIQTNNYLSNASINNNDFVGQIDKIKTIFTFKGFIKIINIFISHLYYIGASSFLLFFVGIYEILNNLKQVVINLNYDEIKKAFNTDEKKYMYIFLLISFLLTIFISVIFLINPNRIDHIIYGRYTEMIIGPILLIGLINLINNRINIKCFVLIIIGFILITIITNLFLSNYNFKLYNLVCSPSLISKPFYSNFDNVYISSVIVIIVGIMVYFFTKKKFLFLFSLSLMCILFIDTGMVIVKNSIAPASTNRIDLVNISSYIKANNDIPTYYLLNGEFENDSYKDIFQFLLKETGLICLSENDLKIVDNNYLIIKGINEALDLSDKYDSIMNVDDFYLLEENKDNIKDLKISLYSFKTFNNNGIIQSNGEEGIFMYGPYINLNSGSYQFTIDIELIKSLNVNIGYIDIVSNIGQNQHFKKEINIIDFDTDNKLLLEVPLDLIESTNNIELRAYAYDGSQIKINNVQINKIY